MNINKINVLWRQSSLQNSSLLMVALPQKYMYAWKNTTKANNNSSDSSSSSDSDSDLPSKSDSKVGSKETITKLNTLLQQLIQNDVVAKTSNLELARPVSKRIPKEQRGSNKIESIEEKLVKAVRDVSKEVGGDVKQTESELLTKLLGPSDAEPSSKSLNDIIKDMKIDREIKPAGKSRAEEVRNILQQMQKGHRQQSSKVVTKHYKQPHFKSSEGIEVRKIDLFGSEPLGIFTNKDLDLKGTETKMWQKLYERDIKLVVTHPPANYFQQMILWTDQGKLWKFPIDNEQGWEEERNVDFSKHVFLEEHLEPWCPQKGPVRHYMELVCTGLSKNPYLTVEAKIEHIEWYKNYFEEKKKLLQDVGAYPIDSAADNHRKLSE